jgi:hypothetical protein
MVWPPYPLEKSTEDALRGLERNEGVIVIPGRAKAIWRAGRWLPSLVEKASRDAVAAFRQPKR